MDVVTWCDWIFDMKGQKDISESEIAIVAMKWLSDQDWDCYPEAQLGGFRADIAAVKDRLLWIVEVKKSLSLALMKQAFHWARRVAVFCSVAYLENYKNNIRKFAEGLCTEKGVGLIRVDARYDPFRIVSVPPRIHRHNYYSSKKMMQVLHEDMKRYVPGSPSRCGGWSTPWHRTIDAAKRYIRSHPDCVVKDIVNGIEHHYRRDSTAMVCLMKWLARDDSVSIDRKRIPYKFYCREE